MNSVLQCLICTIYTLKYNYNDYVEKNTKIKFFSFVKNYFKKEKNMKPSNYNLGFLCRNQNFGDKRQHDAHEYWNNIQVCINNDDLFKNFYYGVDNTYICEECGNTLHKINLSNTLIVPLKKTKLDNIISDLFKDTIIDNNCENCATQKKRRVEEFRPIGDILVVLLERNNYDSSSTKNDQEIMYDEYLKIKNHNYKLYSTIHHIGKTPRSGHYFAECLYNDVWYELNDSRVTKLNKFDNNYNKRKTIYILFYEKIKEAPL